MKKVSLRVLAFCLCLLMALPIAVSAEETVPPADPIRITALETVGFQVENFDPQINYYLCAPASFEGLKIKSVTASKEATTTISVEPYCGKKYTKALDRDLELTYGRVKITITVTSTADPTDTASYLFCLSDPLQDNYRYRYLTRATEVYTEPDENSTRITTLTAGKTNGYMPLCLTTRGEWTQIIIPTTSTRSGKVGWIRTGQLAEEYPAIDMPQSYAAAINALKKAHPNWTFEFRAMGQNLDDYAGHIVDLYYANTGKTVELATVIDAMDPTRYLDEKNVFMFLDVLDHNEMHYTEDGVGGLWSESKNAGITEQQAIQYLLSAGRSLQINTYFLAARAALESGHGTSKLSKGIAGTDGRLYYNYYGIKAYDKDPVNGAYYAEQRNWDTPFRSITEGGNWIVDQYIQRGQSTPYFFRYYPYKDHLYMSDLAAPKKDATSLYTCYKSADKLDEALHFVIPYYEFRYQDVSAAKWYYEDIYRATKLGLFEGMDANNFRPEYTLTRAQLVTVLSRISGVDTTQYTTEQFTDVKAKKWYTGPIAWAYQNQIVKGMSATTFEPDTPISRQDLCTMLVRFAENQNITLPEPSTNIFADDAKIGSWAKQAVYRCVAANLIKGMGKNTFDPRSSATRAQGAKILSLFYENYILK